MSTLNIFDKMYLPEKRVSWAIAAKVFRALGEESPNTTGRRAG